MITDEELPHIAGDLLAEGHDGKAVLDLASFHPPDLERIDEALEKVLIELGIPVPNAAECVRMLESPLLKETLLGNASAVEAAARFIEFAEGGVRTKEGDLSCEALWNELANVRTYFSISNDDKEHPLDRDSARELLKDELRRLHASWATG